MENTNTQPGAGTQEGENTPVADNLGKFDERSLTDFIKNNFLDEEGAAPAKEEQQTESETEEPVAEESSDTEPEVQDEVDQSAEEEDTSQLSRGVQKRINKLVAAKKAAQAKLQEQEAKLAAMQKELEATKSLTAAPKQTQLSSKVESLNSIPEVEAEYKQALDVLMWCEENPDGGEIQGPDGQMVELTDKQVRTMKMVALRNKEIELPARYRYLQEQQSASAKIVQNFPWLNKPETQEYQAAQSVLQEFPEIKRRPDYLHLVGLFVEGMKSFTERTSKPQQTIKRAPAQPSVKAPPAPPKDDARASKAFLQDPSNRDGLSNLLKAKGFV